MADLQLHGASPGPLVEHGAPPHKIAARGGALDVPGKGAKASVQHPGFKGAHMVLIAAVETEAELHALGREHLDRWAPGPSAPIARRGRAVR